MYHYGYDGSEKPEDQPRRWIENPAQLFPNFPIFIVELMIIARWMPQHGV
jgi:hypothetical protein